MKMCNYVSTKFSVLIFKEVNKQTKVCSKFPAEVKELNFNSWLLTPTLSTASAASHISFLLTDELVSSFYAFKALQAPPKQMEGRYLCSQHSVKGTGGREVREGLFPPLLTHNGTCHHLCAWVQFLKQPQVYLPQPAGLGTLPWCWLLAQ